MKPQSWRVAGACVAGLRHARLSKPSQDAFAWSEGSKHRLFLALADGAGSALQGGEGARIAVRSALDFLSRKAAGQLTEATAKIIFREAIEHARADVEKAALEAKSPPRDYASTLLLCIAAQDWTAAAQIGDGAAVFRGNESAPWEALTRPIVEEYLNETVFLQSPDAPEKMQTAFRPVLARHVAIFSDGLQLLALKMPEGAPHGPFLDPLARFVEDCEGSKEAESQLAEFLKSPRVTQRADDDLSLVLAVRVEN